MGVLYKKRGQVSYVISTQQLSMPITTLKLGIININVILNWTVRLSKTSVIRCNFLR